MNIRIGAGSLFGLVLFPTMMYYAPGELFHTMTTAVVTMCLLEVAVANGLLTYFGPRILRVPRGLAIWRTLFCVHSTLYGAAIGYGIAFVLVRDNGGIYGVSLTATLFCGCAVAVSSFAFDFLLCSIFIATIMTPVMYACFVILSGTLPLGMTCAMTAVFFTVLAWTIRNAEIGTMLQEETIKAQAAALRASTEETLRSNNLFQSTLDSIDEIFLTIDLNGVCFGNVSGQCAGVLGLNPVGLPFTEVLRLNGEAKASAEKWFKTAKHSAQLFDKLRTHGPSGWTDEMRQRVFQVRYSPMLGQVGQLEAIIMTMTDVTAQTRAQAAADLAEGRAAMILAISEQRALFGRFIEELTNFFDAAAAGRRHDLARARQQLHTLKGTARLLELRAVAAEINSFEQMLRGHESFDAVVLKHAQHVARAVRGWVASESSLFDKLKVFNSDELTVSRARVDLVKRTFGAEFAGSFDDVVRRFWAHGLNELLDAYRPHVDRVSRKLEKPATLEIDYDGKVILFTDDRYLTPVKALVHVLNNAVDHGLEAPADRVLAGKPERAIIALAVRRSPTGLTIEVRDDGRGIDVAAVRAALEVRGVRTEELSDANIIQGIFEAGLTTKAEAGDLSGHGIGLSALFEAVRDMSGSIEVFTEVGRGTTFQINVPIAAVDVIVIDADPVPAARAA